MLAALYDVTGKLVEEQYPQKNQLDNFSSWFSADLKQCIKDKKQAHWCYKTSSDLSDFIEFKRLRAVCVRLRNLCYAEYIDKVPVWNEYVNIYIYIYFEIFITKLNVLREFS